MTSLKFIETTFKISEGSFRIVRLFGQPDNIHYVLKRFEMKENIEKFFLYELSDSEMIEFISKDRDFISVSSVVITAKHNIDGTLTPISFENIKDLRGKIRICSIVMRKQIQKTYSSLKFK